MDKDQEILAVSRLAFELTKIGSNNVDLDHLLSSLANLLASLPTIRVLAKSAILLHTPTYALIQVAQLGMPPVWQHETAHIPKIHAPLDKDETAFIGTPASHQPPLQFHGVNQQHPCVFLPLLDNNKAIGLGVLFIEPDWQPDIVEIEFMSDLAKTLSILVTRHLITETLRVREVELEDARTDAIRRLGVASEYRDNETGMHIMRMTHYATSIGKALGLSEEMRELLAICAPMHDVGKIGISDTILLKPGRLTEEEYEVMKTHTTIGYRLLTGENNLLAAAREIANCHHERWDGNGYPEGLKGEEIPILARICAIADVFDALTSRRPYKLPWPFEDAVSYIQLHAGIHFDPAAVAAFEQALPEIRRIRELYRDDIINPNQTVKFPETLYREASWVAWDDSLSIGIDVIDEHHRYLFDLTNDLFEVVAGKRGVREVARILKALDQYAQVHFRAEERMMAHYGFDGMNRQLHQHQKFEERLREFYQELHENPLTAQFDALIYLREWLIRHIRQEDAQLKELLEFH